MKLIITESLAEARKFAEVLNSRFRKLGYFQGEEYSILWIDQQVRETGDGQNLRIPFAFKSPENPQLEVIKNLLSKSESLIVATGAGYEGEKKFRDVYNSTNCNLPYKRLWLNELTSQSILIALKNTWEENQFQTYYEIQASEVLRNLESDIYYFICNEYLKNKNQNPQIHYKIELEFKKELTTVKAFSKESWTDESIVKQILLIIQRRKKIFVNKIKYEEITIAPPQLFNLTDIQILCNEELGFSAVETLSILTDLYIKGLITYPQTNATKIKLSKQFQIPEILYFLSLKDSLKPYIEDLKWKRTFKNITGNEDDLFQGIVLTGKISSGLNKSQQAVYNRIAMRLIESLSQPYQYNSMEMDSSVLQHRFTTKSKIINELGLNTLQNNLYEDGVDVLHHLPHFTKDEQVIISGARIVEIESLAEPLKESSILEKFKSSGNPLFINKALESLISQSKLKREYNIIVPVL